MTSITLLSASNHVWRLELLGYSASGYAGCGIAAIQIFYDQNIYDRILFVQIFVFYGLVNHPFYC